MLVRIGAMLSRVRKSAAQATVLLILASQATWRASSTTLLASSRTSKSYASGSWRASGSDKI